MRKQILNNQFGDISSIINKYDYYIEGTIKNSILSNVRDFLVISSNKIIVQVEDGLKLYNLKDKSLKSLFQSENIKIYKSVDENRLVTYGYSSLKIWQLSSYNNLIFPSRHLEDEIGHIQNLCPLSDGRIVVYGDISYIRIWDPSKIV